MGRKKNNGSVANAPLMVYILKWIPFIYAGRTYDLSHLHPFDMKVIQEAKGNKLAIYTKCLCSNRQREASEEANTFCNPGV